MHYLLTIFIYCYFYLLVNLDILNTLEMLLFLGKIYFNFLKFKNFITIKMKLLNQMFHQDV